MAGVAGVVEVGGVEVELQADRNSAPDTSAANARFGLMLCIVLVLGDVSPRLELGGVCD